MVGIYKEEFVQYLKDNLGYVKVSSKNIITRCPYCEYGKEKKHYHLYISLDVPIFHCFHAGCEKSGFLSKLMSHIDGKDRTDQFVDKSLIKESSHKKLDVNPLKEKKALKVPEINTDQFKMKSEYIRYRLRDRDIDITSMKKLIFDVREFVNINNIKLDDRNQGMLEFLQTNFVGFLSERDSLLILRNIDPNSDFRYFKLDISEEEFLDYYRIDGPCYNSNKIVVSEGIFDVLVENMNDSLKIRNSVSSYFATLSGSFQSLLKSVAFHEQIFRQHVIILSHADIDLEVYKKLYKYNSHIIDRLNVYYNSCGKDFGESKVSPVRVEV